MNRGRPFQKKEEPIQGIDAMTTKLEPEPEPSGFVTGSIPIPGLTADAVRSMGVIQIHSLIREKYPDLRDLLDVYNRSALQEEFIKALNL
jgi:hypothetical protein